MREEFARLVDAVGAVVLGKESQVRLALACLLARGHLLIEDIPGIGKTTLAQALATVMGLSFQRVQFTSDLLPGDLLGVSVFEQRAGGPGEFVFHQGPVFTQVLLSDEINRATPKTQSALLEAMEERQVSSEGQTRPLPAPFFVIATQNPIEQSGAFPLPDSQLDRFLMRIHLGYPHREAERRLLEHGGRNGMRSRLEALAPMLSPAEVLARQEEVASVHAADPLLEYVLDLITFTRETPELAVGLSPRAGLGLLAAAKAWAYLEGRELVAPDDVQAVLLPMARHRLRSAREHREFTAHELETLFSRVPIP